MLQLLHQARRIRLHSLGRRMQRLLQPVIIPKHGFGSQRFNPAHPCCHARFGNNLKGADAAGVFHMSTPAQFHGEIPHLHYPDRIAVFLPKQSHCPCLFRFLQAHNLCHHWQGRCNFVIDNRLCPGNLLWRHCCKMGKIKTEPVRIYIRSVLLHMGAQHFPQSFLQQMGSAVVPADQSALFPVY